MINDDDDDKEEVQRGVLLVSITVKAHSMVGVAATTPITAAGVAVNPNCFSVAWEEK